MYRANRSYRTAPPQVPTVPIRIHLIQEAEGAPPPPPDVLLNSPAYHQDVWLAECRRVPSEFWRSIGVKAVFQTSRELEEDYDHFDAATGWRLSGSREELAKKLAKHEVTFESFADRREARAAEEHRKATEAETAVAAAQPLTARVREAREAITALFPNGIRRPTQDEDKAAWAAIHRWKDVEPAEKVAENLIPEKLPNAVHHAFRAAFGPMYDRLPEMPGNTDGACGYSAIYKWNGHYVVYYSGMFGDSKVLQGVSAEVAVV